MLYLIRYGEIALKGLNRAYFENRLASNIKSMVGDGTAKTRRLRGRIILETEKDVSKELKRVFGIVSFSVAYKTNFDDIYSFVLNIVKNKKFDTFRITANRINKQFPKTSEDIARELGKLIVDKLHKKVSLNEYDLNINIEIIDSAYVFFDRVECLGGLPVGVEGKVIVLIETKKGIEAAKRVMKRGCDVIPVSFSEFDISDINLYLPTKRELVRIKNETEIDKIARKENARALVVEDGLENLRDYRTELTILRPLVFD